MTPDPVATAQAVEKLGIIGVLALVIILVGYAAWHFRKELIAAHARREVDLVERQKVIDGLRQDVSTLKLMLLHVKQAADNAGAKYDLRGVGDLDLLLNRER